MYEMVKLDKRGSQYIINHLENGKTLAKELLLFNDIMKSRVTSYVPENTDIEKLYLFKDSTVADFKKSKEFLLERISEFLRIDNRNIVVFENSSSKPSDSWLNAATSRMFFLGEEIYHILLHKDIDKFIIKETLSEASNAWLNIVIFSTIYFKYDLLNNNYVDAEKKILIKEIANNAHMVIVDAYDLDGYVYCERN